MHNYYCVFLFQTNKLVINFGNGKIENLKDCVQKKKDSIHNLLASYVK